MPGERMWAVAVSRNLVDKVIDLMAEFGRSSNLDSQPPHEIKTRGFRFGPPLPLVRRLSVALSSCNVPRTGSRQGDLGGGSPPRLRAVARPRPLL